MALNQKDMLTSKITYFLFFKQEGGGVASFDNVLEICSSVSRDISFIYVT